MLEVAGHRDSVKIGGGAIDAIHETRREESLERLGLLQLILHLLSKQRL